MKHPRFLSGPALRLLLATLALVVLSACGGGGVKQRVYPPSLSLQELRLAPDGAWELSLRLQNFSNVGMRMDSVEARFELGGHAVTTLRLRPGLVVPAGSAEVLPARVEPPPTAAAAVREALASGGPVRYRLSGSIGSSEPRSRQDDFDFESLLHAAPGLDGVMR